MNEVEYPPACLHKLIVGGGEILYEGDDGKEATRLFLAAMATFADRIEHRIGETLIKFAPAIPSVAERMQEAKFALLKYSECHDIGRDYLQDP